MAIIECVICGEQFERPVNNNRTITCSKECSIIKRNKNRRILRSDANYRENENKKRRHGIQNPPKLCSICGSEFHNKFPKVTTCSNECNLKQRAISRKSEEYREKANCARRKLLENDFHREVKRNADREYKKNRYHSDPEYKDRILQHKNDQHHIQWRSDPEYRARILAYQARRRLENPEKVREISRMSARKAYNSQSEAASMLNLMGTMIQINERGTINETDQPE